MTFTSEVERLRAREAMVECVEYEFDTKAEAAEVFDAKFPPIGDAPEEPPVNVPDGEFVNERYWCGCVRESRWVPRCERHKDNEHDEEPMTRGEEKQPSTPPDFDAALNGLEQVVYDAGYEGGFTDGYIKARAAARQRVRELHEAVERERDAAVRARTDANLQVGYREAELDALRARYEAVVRERDAVEAVVRREVCPQENSDPDTDPPYVAMNENGDVFIEADTLAEVVQEMSVAWAKTQERAEKAEAALRAAQLGEVYEVEGQGPLIGPLGRRLSLKTGNDEAERLTPGQRVRITRVEKGA